MNILDALLGEHGLFYSEFDRMKAMLAGPLDMAELKGAVGLLAAGLLSHARLEDELLFPALEDRIGPLGPLSCMRAEHVEIDDSLDRFARIEEVGEARRELEKLLELVRNHFAKEEQVLFPLCRQALGEAVLVELGACWAQNRSVLCWGRPFGEGEQASSPAAFAHP